MTLPLDVVEWLHSLHADPGWAIVTLHEQHMRRGRRRDAPVEGKTPLVELAAIGGVQSLIVVDRRAFRQLPGVALVPLSEHRAFLALRPGCGLADLELAVLDRMDEGVSAPEQQALTELRASLRAWRRDGTLRFTGRSIIVGERVRRGRTKTDA